MTPQTKQNPTEPTRRERRQSNRFRIGNRCLITGRRSALYTSVQNISRGGLSVSGQTPFEEGEEVSVRIMADGRRETVIRSRVVWTRADEDDAPRGMGAQFLEITSGDQLLDDLLDNVQQNGEGEP